MTARSCRRSIVINNTDLAGLVYDIRFGRINESCMIGCAVTRNRPPISVLAPNDQGSDFIELDFVRSCALSRFRWFRGRIV